MNRFAITLCAVLALGASLSFGATPEEQRNRQFQKAEALYLSGHLEEAAAAFDDLSKKYANDARIWLKYGNTLTRLGRYDEAASAFQSALNLDPTEGGAALNQALVRLAQAQAAIGEAVTRLPVGSPEHARAETLQRQLEALLGPPQQSSSRH
jgi:tetratricopeptide (TPR) repeat protein